MSHARLAGRSALPGAILSVMLLVPFLGKAFTIDDTLFLRQAEHVLVDPWHPTAFDIVWTEKPAPLRMSEIMVSGPTMAYLLVPTALAGGAEWVAHLTQLLLLVAGIVATVSIALRCGLDHRGAVWAGTLMAATPAVLAMASAAMPDVAAMTFAAGGLDRYLAWRDGGGWRRAALASVFLTIAVLARTHGLVVLPLAVLLASGRSTGSPKRPPSLANLAPLAAVPFMAFGVLLATRDPQGPLLGVATSALQYSGGTFLGANLVAFATHWTLVFPLAVGWTIAHPRRIFGGPVFYLVSAATAVTLGSTQPAARLVGVALAAGLGAAVLADILLDGRRRHDRLQVVLGLALLAPLPVGFYQHLPSKYLLISAPAAALLIARLASRLSWTAARRVLGTTLPAGVVLGLLIVHADGAFADLGRRAANELIAPQIAAGKTVWFAGHWGFQWYAERAGARSLTLRGPAPRPGDVAVASQNSMGGIIEAFGPRSLVAVLEDRRPGGRIMSRRDGAGFYSNAWGFLPWVWSVDEVLDRYTAWRMDSAGVSPR